MACGIENILVWIKSQKRSMGVKGCLSNVFPPIQKWEIPPRREIRVGRRATKEKKLVHPQLSQFYDLTASPQVKTTKWRRRLIVIITIYHLDRPCVGSPQRAGVRGGVGLLAPQRAETTQLLPTSVDGPVFWCKKIKYCISNCFPASYKVTNCAMNCSANCFAAIKSNLQRQLFSPPLLSS